MWKIGLGVTVCNSWVRNVYTPGFQCCPLEHSTEIAAAWKQGQENSALQILLGYMTEKNLNKLQNQRINDIVQIADMAVNKPCATVKIRGSWLENSRLLLFRWTGDMKKRILVVDDEISIRMGIREFAEYQGYDVTGAANGREALGIVPVSRILT